MRKILFAILAIACLIGLFTQGNDEEIRVRIIPRSDSVKDLEEKEEVKEVVLYYLNTIYDSSYDACMKNIRSTYQDLEDCLDELKYDASVSFDKHTLYNKTYNDSAIKNTEAYTLYVVLGDGAGDNWWGSIYPKFLNVSGDTEIKYESLFVNVVRKIKEK